MKVNYYLPLFLFTISCAFKSSAQQFCSNTLNTTTPTVNAWDWRLSVWPTNIYSTLSGQINSVVSPFYVIQGGNLDNASNANIFSFVQSADKDNKPEDGWELIARNLGTPGQTPVSNAYAIFYNKYSGKIRAFFLVTQLFSETGNNDASKGGTIKISFASAQDHNQDYQSNLFTSYTAPLFPLDQFKRDINIITPNVFRSVLPYWLYADFPVMYDPCTCTQRATLTIECSLLSTSTVEIKINSLPYQSPVSANAVNQNTDFLQGFSSFSGKVEGGLKAATTVGTAFGKLTDAIEKQTKTQLFNKLNSDFSGLNNTVNSIGSWAGLVPLAGTAVNAVTSLIDFFSGGGKSSSTPSGPAPVIILNDFKATGTIESIFRKNNATFYLPGSDQTGNDPALAPVYNNTLGVFNLLYTPEVVVRYFANPDVLDEEIICAENSSQRFVYHSKTTHRTTVQYTLSGNLNNLKYVVNPALNIDLSKSDIRAAFVFENNDYNFLGNHNLEIEVENEGHPILRGSYHPIGNFRNNEAVPTIDLLSYTYIDNPNCPFIMDNIVTNDSYPQPKVYIKIAAVLRKYGAISASEDIVFIGKYPVSFAEEGANGILPAGIEGLPEDLEISNNQLVTTELNTWQAQNSITTGSFYNTSGIPLTLSAGQSVTAGVGAVLKSGSKLTAGNIYPNASALTASRQATPSEVSSFCGGSTYLKHDRTHSAAKEATEPEKDQTQERGEFFAFFPNPASNRVTFNYFIEDASWITLNIIDLSGRIVGQPINDYKGVGTYIHDFDISGLLTGLYIIKFESNKLNRTEKLVIIK